MALPYPVDNQGKPLAIGVKLPDELQTAILDTVHTAVNQMVLNVQQSNKFPDYMNQRQAAAYLGTSPGTLIKWEKSNIGFPTIYIEGSKHYSKAALDEWMKSKQKQSN